MGERVNSTRTNSAQESFFFVGAADVGVKPPFDAREVFRLSAEGVYLGTTSWKYRGWEGMIYAGGYESEAQFQRASLREYTHYFPTVGADFTFFAYPTPEMVAYLANSSPENFRFCPKVTKRITIEKFPDLPVYGKWAGKENPEFLNVEVFRRQFLAPLQGLSGRLGPMIFEFLSLEPRHLTRLEAFFSELPKDISFAVEIRDPSAISRNYYERLLSWGVMPAFQVSSQHPPIDAQWNLYAEAGGLKNSLPFLILADLPTGISADEATRLFQPYSRLVREDPESRTAMVRITEFARQSKRKAFILFHNRWEGSAPQSAGKFLTELARGHSK